jgi:hypothetical protein
LRTGKYKIKIRSYKENNVGGHMGGRSHCTSKKIHVFFYGNGNESQEFGTGFFLYIRESCPQLRGFSL